MPIYQNSIIYKLCHQNDLENNNIYVGSTTNFRNRKNRHKTSCCNEKDKNYNFNVYQFIREHGGWEQFVMIPIEVFPCNDKKELEVKERFYIELLKPKLNQVIPTRTKKEYWCDNKEKRQDIQKKYYDNNIEKRKEYIKNNKENIKNYKNEKVICDKCKLNISRTNLKRHQKTKKCIETV